MRTTRSEQGNSFVYNCCFSGVLELRESETAAASDGPRTSRRYNLISAILAYLMWGGWAYWVNLAAKDAAGVSSPWISGLTQGTGSFLITLVMVRAVSWLYHRLPATTQLWLPATITCLVTGSCLAIAHSLAGTAHIGRTMAPALTIAFLFNVYTSIKLRRSSKNELAVTSQGEPT